jgi:flavin-dependent dehydrogenase
VGAGPAGSCTALSLLAAAPELAGRVLLLDKAVLPREKVCAGAVGARVEPVLARLGVAVGEPAVRVRGLSVALPGGRSTAVRHARHVGAVVRRARFDHDLTQAAAAAGAIVRDGQKVARIDLDARALELASGERVRAHAIVGADGVGSAVRRAMGLPNGPLVAQAVEVDTEPLAGEALDELAFDLTDRSLFGYAWDFPTPLHGRVRVCRGLYELEAGRRVPGRLDVAARLEERLQRLGVAPLGPVRRFSERGACLEQPMARPGVLLVGEAAGIDPALGEGIAQAIEFGDLAGRFVASSLARGDLSFERWPRLVRRARLGFDLAARRRALPIVYGDGRPWTEELLARSPALCRAGMRWFAGERVPRAELARAGLDAVAAAAATSWRALSWALWR